MNRGRSVRKPLRLAAGAVRPYAEGLAHLFWPRCCGACNRALSGGEDWLCVRCTLAMPETGAHRDADHPIAQHFWGRVELESVWARWWFTGRGPVRDLLHRMKYRGRRDLAVRAGEAYGVRLGEEGLLDGFDALVPVPMDRRKLRRRGYNQAEALAEGLGRAAGAPVETRWIERRPGGRTQTARNRFERWASVKSLYRPGPAGLTRKDDANGAGGANGARLLLVDDVITTGSTVEICAGILLAAGARVTAVALAAAE